MNKPHVGLQIGSNGAAPLEQRVGVHEDGEVLGRGREVGLEQEAVVDPHHVHLGSGLRFIKIAFWPIYYGQLSLAILRFFLGDGTRPFDNLGLEK